MIKKVYIYHPSLIITTGLSTIIKEKYNIVCSIIDEVIETKIQVPCLVITNAKKHIPNTISSNLEVEILLISNNKENNDLFLDINAGQLEIENILTPILKKDPEEQTESSLTVREIEVLKLVSLGNSNREIAEKLFISKHTVISHRKNITEKLGIKTIPGLTVYAILNNLIDSQELNIT